MDEKEIWKDIQGYEGLYQVSNLGKIKSLNYNHTGKEELLKFGKDKDGYLFVNLYQDGKGKNFKVHRLVAMAFIDNPDNLFQVNHKDENKENNTVKNLEWCDAKYNINYGTRNIRVSKALKGKTLSEETRKKISEAMSGENNPMYGKHHTEETCKKISEVNKGKVVSEETRKKISEAIRGENHPMYGKHHSEETCKKISENHADVSGENHPMYGKHFSEVSKKKMSKAKKGKFIGENNPNASAVVCMENGKIYSTIKQASKELNLLPTGISACCRGVSKSTKGYHFKYAKTEGDNNEPL